MQKAFSGIANFAKNQTEKESFDAAKRGDLSKLKTFLKIKSSSLNAVNSDGDTLLHVATINNHLPIVQCLVERGADVNARNRAGDTSLMVAKTKGHSNIVNYLLSNNAKDNQTDALQKSTEFNLNRDNIIAVEESVVPIRADVVQSVTVSPTLPQVESKFVQMMRKIKENDKALTHFGSDLNNMGDTELFALAEALETNTQTTDLYLNLGVVSEKSITKFAEVLGKSTTIINLTISSRYNCYSSHLAMALKANRHLINFSSSGHHVSEVEITEFAKALEENISLHSLSLHNANVSNSGAIVIANMLRKNKGLQKLSLEGNQIDDAGAVELAKSATENKILNEMSLGWNKITAIGGAEFAKTMLKNRSVTIALRGNSIGKSLEQQIGDIEYQNMTLKEQLRAALQAGDLDAVKAKIAAGISPFGKLTGLSVLSWAVQCKKAEIAHFLLTVMVKYHPDPLSMERITRHTLLEYAERIRDEETIKVLKEFSRSSEGNTSVNFNESALSPEIENPDNLNRASPISTNMISGMTGAQKRANMYQVVKEQVSVDSRGRSSSSNKMPLDLERSLKNNYLTEDQKHKIVRAHLVNAIMRGNLSSVQWHIVPGKINDVVDDFYGDAMLAVASKWGQLEMVKYLVSQGAEIDQENKSKQTPLLIASNGYSHIGDGKHLEVIKYLHSQGGNIDHPDINEKTPLAWAVAMGKLEIVKYLLSQGANVNRQSISGNTPLMGVLPYMASVSIKPSIYFEIIDHLLSQGADITIKNKDSKTAFDIAERIGNCKPILPKLIEMAAIQQNSSSNSSKTQSLTELKLPTNPPKIKGMANLNRVYPTSAVIPSDLTEAQRHIAFSSVKGNDVIDERFYDDALIHAAQSGHLDQIKQLISRGANINYQTYNGNTSLIVALWYSKIDIANYLLDQGADISIRNKGDKTALEVAEWVEGCKSILPRLREMASKIQQNSGIDTLETQSSTELELPAKPVRQLPAKPSQQYALKSIPSLIASKNPTPKVVQLPSISSVGKAPPVATDPIAALAKMEVSFSIPYKALKIGEKLGEGGCGVVCKGTYKTFEVAIKRLHLHRLSDAVEAEFENEVKVMAKLRSPNIVQFYGVCIDERPFCIVMEYMPKGSLHRLLHSNIDLSWEKRQQIAIDIACGLAYLHAEKLLHRDLKSLNVLLTDDLRAKLTDFGFTNVRVESKMSSSQRNSELVGTPAWIAPEIFSLKPKYTEKSDIYAYGMTLWEIAARKQPYAQVTDFAMLQACVKQGEREDIPENCPSGFAELIKFCWHDKPQQRPDTEEVLTYLKDKNKRFTA